MCVKECVSEDSDLKSPQKHDLFKETLTEACKIHISSRIFEAVNLLVGGRPHGKWKTHSREQERTPPP